MGDASYVGDTTPCYYLQHACRISGRGEARGTHLVAREEEARRRREDTPGSKSGNRVRSRAVGRLRNSGLLFPTALIIVGRRPTAARDTRRKWAGAIKLQKLSASRSPAEIDRIEHDSIRSLARSFSSLSCRSVSFQRPSLSVVSVHIALRIGFDQSSARAAVYFS